MRANRCESLRGTHVRELSVFIRSIPWSFGPEYAKSLNEYARAYYLVGRQNTLPLYMFGAMNSGASPTIYAFSGAVLVASFAAVALIFVRVARRQRLSKVIARFRARPA
jgi:hypothetical protein